MIGGAITILLDPSQWFAQLLRHAELSATAILLSIAIGVPLGAWLTRREKLAFQVINVANVGRTVPSLALLALVYPFVGTGFAPSLIALAALGVPPVLLASYTGVREVDAAMTDAAAGMGLTTRQSLLDAELPVASPVILSGVRTASVQIVASATLATLIGGGGLGDPILAGLANFRYDMLLAGVTLVAALAFSTEMGFNYVERHLLPAGIRALQRANQSNASTYHAGAALDRRRWRTIGLAVAAGTVAFVFAGNMLGGAVSSIGMGDGIGHHGPLPPVRIAAHTTARQQVLAQLYGQALAAQGYHVAYVRIPPRGSGTVELRRGLVELSTDPVPASVSADPGLKVLRWPTSHTAPTTSVAFVTKAGPAYAATVASVVRLLNPTVLAGLTRQAAKGGITPASVATSFLQAHGLAKPGRRPRVVVGSKDFTEQLVLGELYTQALEARGFPVVQRLNLGATAVADSAVRANEINVYPEYTGTMLTAVLKQTPTRGMTESQVVEDVSHGYQTRGLEVLDATPFDDNNAVVVTQATARRLHLRTMSDLARVSGRLRFAEVPGFESREDGMPLLKRDYGMHFAGVQTFEIGLKYKALMDGKVDAAYGFATDGQIAAGHLVVLQDDKRIWPPYNVVPVVSRQFAKTVGPDFAATLNYLSSLLDAPTMQHLNSEVDQQKRDPATVAHDFLQAHGML
jgi:osmoprotectant transport system substrate-binding protein